MKLNYKKLGAFIKEINNRNHDLSVTKLIGVSMEKTFIVSVANVVGTDMSVYKVLKKGQFACKLMSVGRDEKLPVDLYKEDEDAIVSSAYYVFESVDENIVLSEYLFMWLCRPETDRYIGYISGGDVRGGISWETFCDIPIIVPHVSKQKEIIKEYSVITERISLNTKIIEKLEETAQSIYKQWFVDFEFPDTNGMPYSSHGGVMIFDTLLDKEIPENWRLGNIQELSKIEDGDRGKNYPSQSEYLSEGYCLFLGAANLNNNGFIFEESNFISKDRDILMGNGKLQRNDIVFTTRGSKIGKVGYYSNVIEFENIRINSGMVIFRGINELYSLYLFVFLKSKLMQTEILNHLSGSAQPQLPIRDIAKIPIIIPDEKSIERFSKVIGVIQNKIDLNEKMNRKLLSLKNVLLSKLATLQN